VKNWWRWHWLRWIRFYWYKYIRRLDIMGFFMGVPIIRSKWLVPESDIHTIVVDEPWTDKPVLLLIDDELIIARMEKGDGTKRSPS